MAASKVMTLKVAFKQYSCQQYNKCLQSYCGVEIYSNSAIFVSITACICWLIKSGLLCRSYGVLQNSLYLMPQKELCDKGKLVTLLCQGTRPGSLPYFFYSINFCQDPEASGALSTFIKHIAVNFMFFLQPKTNRPKYTVYCTIQTFLMQNSQLNNSMIL